MTIIDLEDTVRFHRPVGEETRALGIQDMPRPPRRPGVSGDAPIYTPPTTFEDIDLYAGRHRAKDPAAVVPPASVPPRTAPSAFRRLIARLGRIGG